MRTQLFVIVAVSSLVAGCDAGRRDGVAEARDRAEGNGTLLAVSVGAGGGAECRAVRCFDVSAEKDLSFVAVEAVGCFGDVEIWLEENGMRLPDVGAPHGQGSPCDGQPAPTPDALKFEGLSVGEDVRVCVAVDGSEGVGAVRIVSKAGQVCEEEVLVDEPCEACETGATTAATATVGAGGAGGEGGAAPTTTAATGAGGSDTTTSVTTGGGEGGAGEGGAGEGGAPPTTVTVGTTTGVGGSTGEGGAGEGGAPVGHGGEGGVCDHEEDSPGTYE